MQARSAKWIFRTIVILCKVVLWLWINISQVVFVYLVVTGRLRQHCIGCFPAKTCLSALGKHCTSNFNVQCSLRRISITLTRKYSYAMLSQYGWYNIALVVFAKKVVCLPWANFAQWFPCEMLTQNDPDNIVAYFRQQSCLWSVQWQANEMIDPLPAGKDFFWLFKNFLVWNGVDWSVLIT